LVNSVAYEDREVPEMNRPRYLLSDEGDASEAADAGTWRLVQALTWGVTTLGEDGVAAL